MSENYRAFLNHLIDDAVWSGDIQFTSNEWCQAYCKLLKRDYVQVLKSSFLNYNIGGLV